MASSSVAWMPSHGRHQVNIGPSLGRAIKSRKLKGSPAPTSKRSNYPERERDFYAFRYSFKPPIDNTKPASIEVKKGPENTQVLAEFPTKLNEVCTYNGTELAAKEVECILIYDEDTGQYTLEKLDSVVSLQYGGKRSVAPSTPSPATEPSTSSTPLTNTKGKAKQDDDDDDDLERMLLEDDNDREPNKTVAAAMLRQEEEEEGEEVEIPLRLQISKRAPPPPTTTNTTRPAKPIPKSRVTNPRPSLQPSTDSTKPNAAHVASKPRSTPLAAPDPPTTLPKPPKPAKRTKAVTSGPSVPVPPAAKATTYEEEEEVFQIERPAKKPRTSTVTSSGVSHPAQAVESTKPPTELSLPGRQSAFVAPPAPAPSPKKPSTTTKTLSPTVPMTFPPGVSATITMEEVLGDEDEDEDEWEAVPTAAAPSQQEYDIQLENEIFGEAFGEDEGQEIDVNAFEAELNEQMEMETFGDDADDDDDDDMEDAMQEAASASTNRPISLNRLASGIAEADSEDDFSSSDSESD